MYIIHISIEFPDNWQRHDKLEEKDATYTCEHDVPESNGEVHLQLLSSVRHGVVRQLDLKGHGEGVVLSRVVVLLAQSATSVKHVAQVDGGGVTLNGSREIVCDGEKRF